MLRFYQWIASWLDILCGAVSVVTFCFYRPNIDYTFRLWYSKRILKNFLSKRMSQNEND